MSSLPASYPHSQPDRKPVASTFETDPESSPTCPSPWPVPLALARTTEPPPGRSPSTRDPPDSVLHSAARGLLLNPKSDPIPPLLTTLHGFCLTQRRSQSPPHGPQAPSQSGPTASLTSPTTVFCAVTLASGYSQIPAVRAASGPLPARRAHFAASLTFRKLSLQSHLFGSLPGPCYLIL